MSKKPDPRQPDLLDPSIPPAFSATDNDDFKTMEKSFVTDARAVMGQLGTELVGSKMATHNILQQSMVEGGPGSIQGALQNLLDYAKIGIRALSLEVDVKRKRLLNMITGREPMPPEVLNKIYDVIRRKAPHLFEDNDTTH